MWAAYSPVKNSPADARAKVAGGTPSHSATTGELDIYAANCRRVPLLAGSRNHWHEHTIRPQAVAWLQRASSACYRRMTAGYGVP